MSTAHGVIGPAPPEDWGEEAENDVHRESTTVTLPSVDLVDCHPFDIASRLIIEPSGKSARRLKLLSFGHPQKVINGADSPSTSHVNVSSKQLPADYGTDILFITPCMISKDSSDIPYAATLVARADRNDKPSIEELRSLVDKVLNGVTAPANSAMQADSHGSLDGSALNAWNWTNKETSRLNYCVSWSPCGSYLADDSYVRLPDTWQTDLSERLCGCELESLHVGSQVPVPG